ncbi:MAG TPA: amidohydrolase family protein [Blastocatellia bacterium]|nr:amidohydrolase family protein [Blastocatellia bacterium]
MTLSSSRFRAAVSLFAILLLIAQFAAFAQDNKKDDKKDDSKTEKKDEELPLKTEEKIEFTTDEGTWMSLDVSPDGKTIVFDLLGDLYTMPVSGGEAKRIIGGLSFESQPRFSPDGKRIVYISDASGAENLWLAAADGANPKPLTKGRNQSFLSPSWTADGNYIIVSKNTDVFSTLSLWMYHKDGGTGVSIGPPDPPPQDPSAGGPPQPPRQSKYGAVASSDGRYIYYARRTGVFSYNAQFPIWQIARFDRDTSESDTITNAQGSAMRPVLSPDGKKLVYATRFETGTALRVRDLETSEERWLINNVTRDDQESRGTRDLFPGYCFMPDGHSLIVPINGKIARVDLESGKATPIAFTAKVEAEIAPRVYFQNRVDDSSMVRARLIRWPAVSPDGKRLAFSSLNKLWIMDFPSGTPRRLTDSQVGEFMPTWSPDGRFIAYVTWSTAGGDINRIAVEGGRPERLTRRTASYSSPVYSPDGSKIVFISGSVDDQRYADLHYRDHDVFPDAKAQAESEIFGIRGSTGADLRWIPAAGGDSKLIAPSQGGRDPHFAGGDSERIYLTTDLGLSSVRLDGYDRRLHLKVTGAAPGPFPPNADQIQLSPDGKMAFVDLQGKHYLVTIPKPGKETLTVSITKEPSSVPVKKMSAEGGDYLSWSSDGKSVTWSWGAKFYRQEIASEKPESIDVAVDLPRHRPKGTVVLSGARIITMNGDEVIERGDIVVTDNRIAAVGAKGKVSVPAGAKVIDVSGQTIIPGFVDVHAHMWPPRGVHQTQVWQYLANLAYGVTTTRDPQSSTTDVFEYTDLVETGDILGPRVYTTGPGVFSSSGLDDKDATRNYIKRYKDAYHTTTLKQYVAGDRIVRQWVAMACKEFGITSTTEGALDLKLDLTQMADGFSGSEHALPIHPLYKDVVQFVAKTGTFYTPTILVAYGAPWSENYWFETTDVHGDMKLRRFIPHALLDTMVQRRGQWFREEQYGHKGIAKAAADIVHSGGRVCLGGHGQMQGIGCHWEIWDLQSGGMTQLEALRAATIVGAHAIGLQQDVGSIEAGKLADLIILSKNPLLDIRNTNTITYVMKNGELFESETLDQIWPAQRKLEKQYWWDNEPK